MVKQMSDRLVKSLKTAKTKRGKRFLTKRGSLVHENAKNLLVMRGSRTTPGVTELLTDITNLRKPLVQPLTRKQREMHPFEDMTSMEYLCQKNDTSLFAFGSASKKRPFRLVLGRMFEHELLDMAEFQVSDYKSAASFGSKHAKVLGAKPMVVFQGSAFSHDEELKQAKSLLLDVFRGPKADKVSLMGMTHVIVISVIENTRQLLFKHYHISFKKSGTKLPHVQCEEIGPRFKLTGDRRKAADTDRWKLALKVPKELKPKKRKNVTTNALGQTLGRVHLGRQDIDKMHTVHFHKPPTGSKKRKAEAVEESD